MPHVTLFPLVVLCILKRIHASIQKSPADTHRPSLSPNLSNTPQVVALEDSLLASRLQPPHSSDLTSDYRRHAHTTGTQLPPPSGTTGPALPVSRWWWWSRWWFRDGTQRHPTRQSHASARACAWASVEPRAREGLCGEIDCETARARATHASGSTGSCSMCFNAPSAIRLCSLAIRVRPTLQGEVCEFAPHRDCFCESHISGDTI